MQEEYVIKLKILTDALKGSISQVKGMIHSFKNDIKQDTKVNFTIDNNLTLKQLQKFKSDIESELTKLQESSKIGTEMKIVDPNEAIKIKNLTAGLTMVKERIAEIGRESDDTKEKMSGISINANMTNNTIVNGFKNSWKSIKRFAFSLLSLRGIYGLVRKASSAYMAQDTQLSQQLQRTWASVGAMLAPVIETLVKWIRIGAAYLNYFVKMLTGKDLIGKAVKKINSYNKSLGGTAKSAKALNKELTTLDEVTNLSFDDANTTGIEDTAQAFDDFGDIKLDKKVTDMLDTLAEKVKQVGKFLKPIIDLAVAHPGAVLTILGGAKLLSLVTKLTGTGGLGTLTGLLKGLATVGVVVAGVDLIYSSVTGKHLNEEIAEIKKGLEDLNNRINANTTQQEENAKTGKKVNEVFQESIKTGKKTTKQYQAEADKLFTLINLDKKQIENKTKQYTLTGMFTNANKKLTKQTKSLEDEAYSYLKTMGKYYDANVLNTEQTEKYKKTLEEEIEYYKKNYDVTRMNSDEAEKYKSKLNTLQEQLNKVSRGKYTANMNVDTTDATNKTNTFKGVLDKFKNSAYTAKLNVDNSEAVKKTNDLKNNLNNNIAKTFKSKIEMAIGTRDAKQKITNFLTPVNNAFSRLGIGSITNNLLNTLLSKIPAYDVGTNYVPNDQLAMVHKGEAIVPKKFNNQQFFNQSNEETNALLVEVNQNLIELRNRPNVLEVNGKELAQATYNDYQNEGNRLNQSMTIKKVGGN